MMNTRYFSMVAAAAFTAIFVDAPNAAAPLCRKAFLVVEETSEPVEVDASAAVATVSLNATIPTVVEGAVFGEGTFRMGTTVNDDQIDAQNLVLEHVPLMVDEIQAPLDRFWLDVYDGMMVPAGNHIGEVYWTHVIVDSTRSRMEYEDVKPLTFEIGAALCGVLFVLGLCHASKKANNSESVVNLVDDHDSIFAEEVDEEEEEAQELAMVDDHAGEMMVWGQVDWEVPDADNFHLEVFEDAVEILQDGQGLEVFEDAMENVPIPADVAVEEIPAPEEEEDIPAPMQEEDFPAPVEEEEIPVALEEEEEVQLPVPLPAPVPAVPLRRSARIAALKKKAVGSAEVLVQDQKGLVLVSSGGVQVRRSARNLKKKKTQKR